MEDLSKENGVEKWVFAKQDALKNCQACINAIKKDFVAQEELASWNEYMSLLAA